MTPAPHSSGLAAPASPPAPPPPGEPPGVSDAAWGGAGGIVGSGAAAAWCPAQVGGGAGACMCGMCGMCGSRQQRSPWPRPIRHSLQQYLHVGVPGVALGCVPLVYRGCAAPLSHIHKLVYRIHTSLCIAYTEACVYAIYIYHKLLYRIHTSLCTAGVRRRCRSPCVCMHVCMYVYIHTVCMHARMHVCIHACVHACMSRVCNTPLLQPGRPPLHTPAPIPLTHSAPERKR